MVLSNRMRTAFVVLQLTLFYKGVLGLNVFLKFGRTERRVSYSRFDEEGKTLSR